MKKIGIQLLFSILTVSYSFTAYSQNFSEEAKTSMGEIRKLLDNNERSMTEDAKNNFEEANLILETVDNQDFELEKYFVKGSTPKAEKKSVNVKRNRIDASVLYEKGYSNIVNAHDTRIDKLYYTFPEDKTEALKLKEQALAKMNDAKSKMDDYKFLDDKDLITYKYHTLQDDIEEVNKMFREAIDIQIDAFNLFFEQDKKQQEIAETEAPTSQDTSQSESGDAISESLVSNLSDDVKEQVIEEFDGTGIIEKTEIAEPATNSVIEPIASSGQEEIEYAIEDLPTAIEEPVAAATPSKEVEPVTVAEPVAVSKPAPAPIQQMSTITGVVFRVQLIAVKKGPLSSRQQSKIYSGPLPLQERQENGMYKYTIGEFSTFREARSFRKNLQIKDSFIVAFRDGKRIPLDEAIGYAY